MVIAIMHGRTSELREKLRHAPEWVYLGPNKVGRGHPTYFIAEIGNNHNGDFYLAKRSIEEAAKAGAHAVKFQKRSVHDTFAKELRDKPQTKDEIKGKTYGEYREGLEFSFDDFIRLKEIADFNGVAFFATPFDLPSVDFLEKAGMPFYKIASFDVTNIPLLERVARTNKPIILSTGMATLEEVDEAVTTVLAHHANLIVLHCVSVYPSPDEHINLGAMRLLKRLYAPLPIGYSGHEQDILPTLMAIAHGATIVERHFTLSKLLPGPDHASVSIDPGSFKEMMDAAARIHVLYGKGEKELLEQERITRNKHAKSIVASIPIANGTVITETMLTCKSPGYGLRPRELSVVVGKRASHDIMADTVLRHEDIEWEPALSGVLPAREKNA
ncbi:MAG: N-acetylneuraminate synthase [Candidatus Adlerbacteria bacterium GW2011_GWA1_54_10]|uniref:N-acetylneuraminate synthase n=3 Tax=Candidatus Adleribacteriota TaxID=1752736 RepID=A0A0G1XXU8_9BACT|nr:MAG: N-acetylneuraminate synthase [Candidatus Adlerbacteria bacterium GW2011_GWA1_54_10]KKW37454.1 MAG: N-acetylneuraminate synthase [Candidatus Adlerbacteria bacterium GW2011_GWB1_54_7]